MGKRMTRSDQMILAESIIDTFERCLESYHIDIPNSEKKDRNNEEGISNIYGTDYAILETEIIDILKNNGLISKTYKENK